MSDIEANPTEYAEDDEIHQKAHKRLLDGVSSLHTTQFIKKATRNEAAAKRSEFHLVKSSVTTAKQPKCDKVNVSDLLNVLDKTSKHLDIGKKLKKTTTQKKVLAKPLEKPAAEKLQRAINYEKTKEKLLRWEAIVAKQKSADHLVMTLISARTSFSIVRDHKKIIVEFFAVIPTKPGCKRNLVQRLVSDAVTDSH